MVYQISPQLPVVVGIFLLLFSLAAYGGLQYHRRGHQSELLAFTSLMAGLSLWVLITIFVDMVPSVELKLLGYNFTNTVLVLFSLYSLLWFALAYSDNDQWVNRWSIGMAIGTVAVTSAAAIIAPEFLYSINGLSTNGPVTVLGVTFEEWVVLDREPKLPFRFLQLFSYIIMVASASILLRYILQNRNDMYMGQAVALGIGIGSPLIANSLLFVSIVPTGSNITDISFGITGIALAIAIFRYRMLRVAPVGRQQLVDILTGPVVMLTADDRIVDCNSAARDLVDAPEEWHGMAAKDFFAPFPDQFQRFVDTESVETEIRVRIDDEIRHFKLSISPITNNNQTTQGRLVVLNDVTDQKLHEQQLQRQNERLDRFASVVSHDLRNPLNVAQGRVDLAMDDCDTEHLDAAADGIERSLDLIEDLLTLTREGQEIGEPEPVEISDLVQTCWNTVNTGDGTIVIQTDSTIRADRSRLRQILENLFRNAVEHGGKAVTVRVGTVPDGFYVEDDGPGIPEDERGEVFTAGYSTDAEGTGFGLSIVKEIVEAHDWEIQVVEGTDGGARFEVTGVEFIAD